MYTKHKWKSDKYYNFGYVQYLPKNFDETKKYRNYSGHPLTENDIGVT